MSHIDALPGFNSVRPRTDPLVPARDNLQFTLAQEGLLEGR
jgi:hypothetical protein